MDFDTFVSLMFLFFFFVLPSVLRQLRKKAEQKKPVEAAADDSSGDSPPPVKPKKTKRVGLFAKIGEQIRQVLKEIEEQQRRQQREAAQAETENVWQELADEDFSSETGMEQAPETSPEPARDIYPPSPRKYIKPDKPAAARGQVRPGGTRVSQEKPVRPADFRKNALQNAVVWAEILGKPVALKETDRF